MKNTFLALLIFSFIRLSAQPFNYSVANAHSHNDYNNPIPFYAAYTEGFGSIEADILLQDGILYVGHSTDDIKYKRTLEDYYIKPLLAGVRKNNGFPYADGSKSLQLLIDIKTGAIPTLDTLISLLKKYPELINTDKIKWVISGNRPDASKFSSYPSFIWFDGNIEDSYSNEALSKIVMLSADLKNYTEWNGKSNTTSESEQKIKAAVAKVHGLNKLIRFWDAPDIINTWYELMHFGVDYINTDHIHELASFLNKLPRNSFVSKETYTAYQPTYKSDGSTKKVKNIILLIGDGTSLAQLYAGYTANKGALNLFQMMNIGLSKTSSYDNYITDSAPGSTAISSGIKTNNRFVGVDHTGKAVPLIPLFAAKRKIKTGIITCGDIADATPADFYAHQSSRDDATAILKDLLKSPIDILMGSGDESLNNVGILKESDKSKIGEDIVSELRTKYKLVSSIDSVKENTKDKWIVIEKKAGLSILDGRGNWMQQAFAKTINILSKNKEGFFMMAEGAQIDYGGHDNNIGYVATEVMDFDKTIGDALRFADKDGETLVIVTADHETGGLTLLDGDYSKGYVSGQFSTNDHTALPVQVFAYGPQSFRFRGVYENTALFKKILNSFGLN
ncbi:MAG: alkaline phosphatase [Bacteroidetes bacterium]|nr:alkaline phosphatase [Bacteroidota bacterium]